MSEIAHPMMRRNIMLDGLHKRVRDLIDMMHVGARLHADRLP